MLFPGCATLIVAENGRVGGFGPTLLIDRWKPFFLPSLPGLCEGVMPPVGANGNHLVPGFDGGGQNRPEMTRQGDVHRALFGGQLYELGSFGVIHCCL